MKRISTSIVVVALSLCAAIISFGQSQSGATAPVPSFPFEILDQPGCPLSIGIDDRLGAPIPAAVLRITNNDPSTVNAYVLHVNGGSVNDRSDMVFLLSSGIAPGEFHTRAESIRAIAEKGDKPVISVDYVHFVDGNTWGADSLGRSKDVKSFIEGRSLAISRLRELLAGQDDTDFMKSVEVRRSSSFGELARPTGRSPRRADYFARGYEEIINILRRMSRRSDEAKDLARKLELTQNSRTP